MERREPPRWGPREGLTSRGRRGCSRIESFLKGSNDNPANRERLRQRRRRLPCPPSKGRWQFPTSIPSGVSRTSVFSPGGEFQRSPSPTSMLERKADGATVFRCHLFSMVNDQIAEIITQQLFLSSILSRPLLPEN